MAARSLFRRRAELLLSGYRSFADYSGADCGFLRGNATRGEGPDLDSIEPSSDDVMPFGMISDGVN